jgi:hypothetical protein
VDFFRGDFVAMRDFWAVLVSMKGTGSFNGNMGIR